VKHHRVNIKKKSSQARSLWILLLFFVPFGAAMPHSAGAATLQDSLSSRRSWVPAVVGGTLIGAGLTEHVFSHAYSRRLDPTFRESHGRLADWGRFAPKLLQLGLAFSGQTGRYSNTRTLVSDVIGFAALAGSTSAIKNTTGQLRPDGTDRKSFPSGHAAMAFVTATMLDEEYGHVSPLITIGGYALSTATAFDRARGNRHYAGDVLAGAGIGIVSARLGYWIGSLIFGHRGITAPAGDDDAIYEIHPTFLGFNGGVAIPVGHRDKDQPRADAGLTEGIEGAWFRTWRWGWGGQISQSHQLLHHDGHPIAASVDVLTAETGPYYSYPLADGCRLGAKLTAGYSIQDGGRSEVRRNNIKVLEGPSLTTGLNLGYVARERLEVRLNVNYHVLWSGQALQEIVPSIGLSYLF
jgi:hypothetical protein